jgi:hypothetical protein
MEDLEMCQDNFQPENAESSPTSNQPGLPDELAMRRLERITEYKLQALAKRNTLRSILGSLNAGLCEVTVGLESLVKQALPLAATSPQREERLQKSIAQLVKLNRQIDRYSNNERRQKPRRKSKIVDVTIVTDPPAEPPVDGSQSGDLQS